MFPRKHEITIRMNKEKREKDSCKQRVGETMEENMGKKLRVFTRGA